jgi:hypothetical protein
MSQTISDEVDARGAFYQPKTFINAQVPKVRRKKHLVPDNWDNRWNVTHSKANEHRHPFYKQYFDKEPAETHFNFQYAYGHTSPTSLPGIIDVNHIQQPKNFYKGSEAHADHVTLTKETRMPIEYLTAQSTKV